MKARILAILITLAPLVTAQTPGVVIFGDSICSAEGSWAELLRDYGWRVKLHCQGGRLAGRKFQIPPDLRVYSEFQFAVYAPGTNDGNAVFASPSGPHLDNFAAAFEQHMTELTSKNFVPIVLIPAAYPRMGQGIIDVRNVMLSHCDGPMQIVCVDMEKIWVYSETPDEVHPSPALHAIIVERVNNELRALPIPNQTPGC